MAQTPRYCNASLPPVQLTPGTRIASSSQIA
jgi:hypothetical protein